jgi:hypothetical protein
MRGRAFALLAFGGACLVIAMLTMVVHPHLKALLFVAGLLIGLGAERLRLRAL